MALFTNKEDANLNLITQIAQVNTRDRNEVQDFVHIHDTFQLTIHGFTMDHVYDLAGKIIALTQEILNTCVAEGGITEKQVARIHEADFAVQQFNARHDAERQQKSLNEKLANATDTIVPAPDVRSTSGELHPPDSFLLRLINELQSLFDNDAFRRLKVCPICNSVFLPTPSRHVQLYCSKRCLYRHHTRLRRSKERDNRLNPASVPVT